MHGIEIMTDQLEEDEEIIREFLIECGEHLDILDNGLVIIEQDPLDKKTLSSVFRSIHTIKGGSGMLSFNKLERLTHSAENLLSLLRDGKLNLNSNMITVLLSTMDAVRTMLKSISVTGADGDNLYNDVIENINHLIESPESALTTKQVDEPQVVEQVEEQELTEPLLTNELPTFVPALELSGELTPSASEAPVLIDEITEPSSSVIQEDIQHAELKTNMPNEASIRINVDLLDKLMNLVGELVLSRNQILQFVSTISDSNFITVSQRLNLITSELQEGVMKTRMQPIGNVWGKFIRVVRDLATSCNKRVNLEMYGKETELDKTLIEAIKDPLTHIVRNSVDHGIETPDVRKAAGKPEEGTLSLKAYHEGGHVNIEIYDDGGGISAEKVKAKALQRELITGEQANRMSEREALNLIFLPGLSTAERITNVSGRGVGMDVVRTNIERINGTIELQSKLGQFTLLKIKIPLTLAIIPALIVTCQENRYAIPQSSLLELVHLEPEDINANVQFIKDTPLYRLRGKLLPLVYLAKELELVADPTTENTKSSLNLVVLQAGEVQFGLVVDHINDTQEIVVKPLSKLLKNQFAFSGATIMGDGKISLILDVTGFARKAGLLSSNLEAKRLRQVAHIQEDQNQKQALLLLRAGIDKLMAVPMNKVQRIEEFMISSIETVGNQEVVQYRKSIMPLVHLGEFINQSRLAKAENEKVQVVVHSLGERNFGLIVDHVYDIVEGNYAVHNHIKRKGILGTSIIEEKVTEILDIDFIINNVLPHYFNHTISETEL